MKKFGIGNIFLSVLCLSLMIILFDPNLYRQCDFWFMGRLDNKWIMEHSGTIFAFVTVIFLSLVTYLLLQYSKKANWLSLNKIIVAILLLGFVIGSYGFIFMLLWIDRLNSIQYVVFTLITPIIISALICFMLKLGVSYSINRKTLNNHN